MNEYRIDVSDLGYYSVVDMPSDLELQDHYANKYFQDSSGNYEGSYSSDELLFFQNKIMQRYTASSKICKKTAGKFLDVGCGEGFALRALKKQGWDVCGIDFSDNGIKAHNVDCHEFLKVGDFMGISKDLVSDGEKFDMIWLTNVLEHVREPAAILKRLQEILSPGGVAAITVPNDFSDLQKLFETQGSVDSEYWVTPPEHLHYFNAQSLENFSSKCGFLCEQMLADFPIDWFIANDQSNYVADKKKGKAGHMARLAIENLMAVKSIDDINRFYSELANLGFGRNITAFLTVRGKA